MPDGDLLVSTVNTDEQKQYDGNNAVDRLSPSLTLRDFFAPTNWRHLNLVDFDPGSVGPTVIAGDRVFQVGKDGIAICWTLITSVGSAATCSGSRSMAVATPSAPPRIAHPWSMCPAITALPLCALRDPASTLPGEAPDFRSGSPIAAGLVWDFDFEGGSLWGFDPLSGSARQKVSVGYGEHFVSLSSSSGRL
jgi:hypothetical protein